MEIASVGDPRGLGIIDTDVDGHLDLVVGGYDGSQLAVHHGTGDGDFDDPIFIDAEFGEGAYHLERVYPTYMFDPWPDVVVAARDAFDQGYLLAFRGLGDGSLGSPTDLPLWPRKLIPFPLNYAGVPRVGVEVAEMNGDGAIDYLIAQPPNNVFVALGTASEGVDGLLSGAYESANAIHAVDVDGDGDRDLLASRPDEVVVLVNAGDASFEAEATLAHPALGNGRALRAIDADGDGTLELLAPVENATAALFDIDPIAPALAYIGDIDAGSSEAGELRVADIDGDGLEDIVFLRWDYDLASLVILLNSIDSPGSFTAIEVASDAHPVTFMPIQQLAVADLNEDGALDVAAVLGQGSDFVRIYFADP